MGSWLFRIDASEVLLFYRDISSQYLMFCLLVLHLLNLPIYYFGDFFTTAVPFYRIIICALNVAFVFSGTIYSILYTNMIKRPCPECCPDLIHKSSKHVQKKRPLTCGCVLSSLYFMGCAIKVLSLIQIITFIGTIYLVDRSSTETGREIITMFLISIFGAFIPLNMFDRLVIGLLASCMVGWRLFLFLPRYSIAFIISMTSFSFTLIGFVLLLYKNPIFDVSRSVKAVNNMATMIMNMFLNSLPSRTIPHIMRGDIPDAVVIDDVVFCYLAVKLGDSEDVFEQYQPHTVSQKKVRTHATAIDRDVVVYLSKLNQLYCLLDFLADVIGVQKIKTTYTSYMAVSGLAGTLEVGHRQLRAQPSEEFKLAATFALAAQAAAISLGIDLSCGITRGPVVTGFLGLGKQNLNMDVWGDAINTAARIAHSFSSGVHIMLTHFRAMNTPVPPVVSTRFEDLAIAQMVASFLPSHSAIHRAHALIRSAPPCYSFQTKRFRIYKGKGELPILELRATSLLYALTYEAFSDTYNNILTGYLNTDTTTFDSRSALDELQSVSPERITALTHMLTMVLDFRALDIAYDMADFENVRLSPNTHTMSPELIKLSASRENHTLNSTPTLRVVPPLLELQRQRAIDSVTVPAKFRAMAIHTGDYGLYALAEHLDTHPGLLMHKKLIKKTTGRDASSLGVRSSLSPRYSLLTDRRESLRYHHRARHDRAAISRMDCPTPRTSEFSSQNNTLGSSRDPANIDPYLRQLAAFKLFFTPNNIDPRRPCSSHAHSGSLSPSENPLLTFRAPQSPYSAGEYVPLELSVNTMVLDPNYYRFIPRYTSAGETCSHGPYGPKKILSVTSHDVLTGDFGIEYPCDLLDIIRDGRSYDPNPTLFVHDAGRSPTLAFGRRPSHHMNSTPIMSANTSADSAIAIITAAEKRLALLPSPPFSATCARATSVGVCPVRDLTGHSASGRSSLASSRTGLPVSHSKHISPSEASDSTTNNQGGKAAKSRVHSVLKIFPVKTKKQNLHFTKLSASTSGDLSDESLGSQAPLVLNESPRFYSKRSTALASSCVASEKLESTDHNLLTDDEQATCYVKSPVSARLSLTPIQPHRSPLYRTTVLGRSYSSPALLTPPFEFSILLINKKYDEAPTASDVSSNFRAKVATNLASQATYGTDSSLTTNTTLLGTLSMSHNTVQDFSFYTDALQAKDNCSTRSQLRYSLPRASRSSLPHVSFSSFLTKEQLRSCNSFRSANSSTLYSRLGAGEAIFWKYQPTFHSITNTITRTRSMSLIPLPEMAHSADNTSKSDVLGIMRIACAPSISECGKTDLSNSQFTDDQTFATPTMQLAQPPSVGLFMSLKSTFTRTAPTSPAASPAPYSRAPDASFVTKPMDHSVTNIRLFGPGQLPNSSSNTGVLDETFDSLCDNNINEMQQNIFIEAVHSESTSRCSEPDVTLFSLHRENPSRQSSTIQASKVDIAWHPSPLLVQRDCAPPHTINCTGESIESTTDHLSIGSAQYVPSLPSNHITVDLAAMGRSDANPPATSPRYMLGFEAKAQQGILPVVNESTHIGASTNEKATLVLSDSLSALPQMDHSPSGSISVHASQQLVHAKHDTCSSSKKRSKSPLTSAMPANDALGVGSAGLYRSSSFVESPFRTSKEFSSSRRNALLGKALVKDLVGLDIVNTSDSESTTSRCTLKSFGVTGRKTPVERRSTEDRHSSKHSSGKGRRPEMHVDRHGSKHSEHFLTNSNASAPYTRRFSAMPHGFDGASDMLASTGFRRPSISAVPSSLMAEHHDLFAHPAEHRYNESGLLSTHLSQFFDTVSSVQRGDMGRSMDPAAWRDSQIRFGNIHWESASNVTKHSANLSNLEALQEDSYHENHQALTARDNTYADSPMDTSSTSHNKSLMASVSTQGEPRARHHFSHREVDSLDGSSHVRSSHGTLSAHHSKAPPRAHDEQRDLALYSIQSNLHGDTASLTDGSQPTSQLEKYDTPQMHVAHRCTDGQSTVDSFHESHEFDPSLPSLRLPLPSKLFKNSLSSADCSARATESTSVSAYANAHDHDRGANRWPADVQTLSAFAGYVPRRVSGEAAAGKGTQTALHPLAEVSRSRGDIHLSDSGSESREFFAYESSKSLSIIPSTETHLGATACHGNFVGRRRGSLSSDNGARDATLFSSRRKDGTNSASPSGATSSAPGGAPGGPVEDSYAQTLRALNLPGILKTPASLCPDPDPDSDSGPRSRSRAHLYPAYLRGGRHGRALRFCGRVVRSAVEWLYAMLSDYIRIFTISFTMTREAEVDMATALYLLQLTTPPKAFATLLVTLLLPALKVILAPLDNLFVTTYLFGPLPVSGHFLEVGMTLIFLRSFIVYGYALFMRRRMGGVFSDMARNGERSTVRPGLLVFHPFVLVLQFIHSLVVYMLLLLDFINKYSFTIYNEANQGQSYVSDMITYVFVFMPAFLLVTMINVSPSFTYVYFISSDFIALTIALAVSAMLVLFIGATAPIFIVFIYIVLLIYVLPMMRIFEGTMVLNKQIAATIRNGKSLLKPILPTLTMDTMLSSCQNHELLSVQSMFPFIAKYKNSMQRLYCMRRLEAEGCIPQFAADHGPLPASEELRLRDVCMQRAMRGAFYKYLRFRDPRYLPADRPILLFNQAGYLSLDVVNFTRFSSENTAQDILLFINTMFNMFDRRISMSSQLMQVKSVGDAYEVMGLPGSTKELGARRGRSGPEEEFLAVYDALLMLVAAGFGFISDCHECVRLHFPAYEGKLTLRVGVAYGSMFGSLLGNRLYRFDVFGTVPSHANAVQTAADPGTVYVNEIVRKILVGGEEVWMENYFTKFAENAVLRNAFDPRTFIDERVTAHISPQPRIVDSVGLIYKVIDIE